MATKIATSFESRNDLDQSHSLKLYFTDKSIKLHKTSQHRLQKIVQG